MMTGGTRGRSGRVRGTVCLPYPVFDSSAMATLVESQASPWASALRLRSRLGSLLVSGLITGAYAMTGVGYLKHSG